jgi:hypothetical protein
MSSNPQAEPHFLAMDEDFLGLPWNMSFEIALETLG